MHELGIVYQIVKTVDAVKKEQSLSEIDTIVLQIGEMSDVVPKFIEKAWDSVKSATAYGNTKMEIEVIPARAKCTSCNFEADVKSLGLTCPECGSAEFKILSGREFLIKEIIAK